MINLTYTLLQKNKMSGMYTLMLHTEKLSESDIENILEDINWTILPMFQDLSETFIDKYKDKIDWFTVSVFQKLSETFIEKFQDRVLWHWISLMQDISENFIEKFQNKVKWTWIVFSKKLSPSFSQKFNEKIKQGIYSKKNILFLRDKIKRKIIWKNISCIQNLSESFIESFQDKLDWTNISTFSTLSKSFIEKFNHRIDWQSINYKPVPDTNIIVNSWFKKKIITHEEKGPEIEMYKIKTKKYILGEPITEKFIKKKRINSPSNDLDGSCTKFFKNLCI